MEPRILAKDAASTLGITLQAIHKRLKSKNLNFAKTQNRVYFGHNTAKELFEFKFMKPIIIGFQNVKGGVGKTTLTQSVAVRASLYGARVLCIDADKQGNLSEAFKIDASDKPILFDVLEEKLNISDSIVNALPGIDLIPSRLENGLLDSFLTKKPVNLSKLFKKLFKPVLNNYDLIIFDCPPDIGHTVAGIALMADYIVAPVNPDKLSISGLKMNYDQYTDLASQYELDDLKIRVLFNKFDHRTNSSFAYYSQMLKHHIYGENMFKTYIRTSQEFTNSMIKGITIFDNVKYSTAKEDIDLITKSILGVTKEEQPITI